MPERSGGGGGAERSEATPPPSPDLLLPRERSRGQEQCEQECARARWQSGLVSYGKGLGGCAAAPIPRPQAAGYFPRKGSVAKPCQPRRPNTVTGGFAVRNRLIWG